MSNWQENPLIRRELLYRLRPQPSQRPVIVLVVALCLIAVVLFYWAALESIRYTTDYRDLLTATLVIQTLLVCVGAPAATANAVSREREQRTWDLLTVTLLKPHEVVLGKLVGRIIPLLGIVALGLPMIVLCVIGAPDLLLSALLGTLCVLVTLILYSTAGLAASCFSRKTVTATVLAYLFVGAWVFGTLILWGLTELLLPSIGRGTATVWMTVNPLAVIEPVVSKFSPGGWSGSDMLYGLSPWVLLVVYAGLTLVLVWLMVSTYRRWAYR